MEGNFYKDRTFQENTIYLMAFGVSSRQKFRLVSCAEKAIQKSKIVELESEFQKAKSLFKKKLQFIKFTFRDSWNIDIIGSSTTKQSF